MESFSLLSSSILGMLSSILIEVLKRPELDYGWLKYIKTGKIAIFVVCFIAVLAYVLYYGIALIGLNDWKVLLWFFTRTVISAFLMYAIVIKQLGI